MKKEDVIQHYRELVAALGEDPHHVVLSAGAAAVMMGIRDETDDLDVDVLPGVFKWVCGTKPVIVEENVSDRVAYSDHVDLHVLDEDRGVVCIDGIWVYSPRELLAQKRKLAKMPNRTPGKMLRDSIEIGLLEELAKSPVFTARAV